MKRESRGYAACGCRAVPEARANRCFQRKTRRIAPPDPSFAGGLNTYAGVVTCQPVAEAHGLSYKPLAEVLS